MNASRYRRYSQCGTFILAFMLSVLSFQAISEDIEIFSSDPLSAVGKPNVLIVIDNSANWSRQSQKWPGGLTQGQSEVRAIKQVINSLQENSINVGLMEYSTDGNSNTNEGAYLRRHIRPLSNANRDLFKAELDIIDANINAPIEKRSSGNGYGTLMWDVYNYLGSFNQSQNGAGTPASRADTGAYSSQFGTFRSPLTLLDFCRRTIVIFIGNNVSSGPSKDADNAIAALTAAGGDASQIDFAEYQVTTEQSTVNRGYSSACYATDTACSAAENNSACTDQGFESCYCDAADKQACSQSHYTVFGTKSQSQVKSDNNPGVTGGTKVATPDTPLTCAKAQDVPTYACPATSTVTQQNTPAAGETTETITSWGSCAYVETNATGCNGQRANYEPRGFKTTRTRVSVVTSTTDNLGLSASCSNSSGTCDTSTVAACTNGSYNSCVCSTPADTTGCPGGITSRFQVVGRTTFSSATPTGNFSTPSGGPWIADEWAKFLRQTGVPLPGSAGLSHSQVSTYTIDVFNAQQNANFSALLFNMARVGGGKYYQAKNEDQIVTALTNIFVEVQAVNSAFSSASLPVNATNRTQSENQVYIGVFKPDRTKDPRWFGNLKRYQLVLDDILDVELGDATGKEAINKQTGFISDCAVSFWTTESGNYWEDVIADDPDAASTCAGIADAHSDYPDGPFVEKGAAAQILRRSNSASAAPDANGNYAVSRNMKTLNGSSLVNLSASALSTVLQDYVRGTDNGANPIDEDVDGVTTETRASIHGDVIHSRPQPVNFGGSTGVVVYYGANDGAYRAVKGSTGEELWSFVAPEHYAKLARLRLNAPLVNFAGGLTGKDYFFDGSTGVYQNQDNSKVHIYPSQRRGGRNVYGFNVSSPQSDPTMLWKVGCPVEGLDLGCTSGFSAMGQSWSKPTAAFIKGFSETVPVVIFGGGYDKCEDENSPTPNCATTKGQGVFVVNGTTGALIKYFDFSSINAGARGVSADIALADINADGLVDFAYAADMGGNIYRMDFVSNVVDYASLAPADWKMSRVAYTNGSNRKFLYTPTLVINRSTVYLAIGSGDREHPLASHYTNSVVNRFYVFKDNVTDIDDLTQLNLDDPSAMANYTTDPGCDASTKILPSSAKFGWFIDLTAYGAGEQVVTTPVIAAGLVYFSTNRPTPPSDVACTNNLGEARGYIVNLFNGSGAIGVEGSCGGDRSSEFTGGGLPPSPVIATVPIEVDGQIIIKTVVIGAAEKDGTVSSIVGAQQVRPLINSARRPISWRKNLDTD